MGGIRPPEPINEQDYFAHDERLHFQLLRKFFKNFIAENSAAIKEHWCEIYYWTKALHAQLPECPPVTENINEPDEKDLEKFEIFCAWTVNIVSYIHWFMHTHQTDLQDFRKVVFAEQSKGLNVEGEMVFGGNAELEDLNNQRLVAEALLGAKIKNELLSNPNNDFHPDLVELFKLNIARYKTPNIEKMSGSVNI